MHHTLKLYALNRRTVLRLYIFLARLTQLPFLGRLVRHIANAFGHHFHHAYLLTMDEAVNLISIASGLALAPCDCRRTFRKCTHPVSTEILLGPTRKTLIQAMPGDAREITREQALNVISESHRRGLILSITQCREDFYAICSCCSCCCVPLRLSRRYGIGEALLRHRDIVSEYRKFQETFKG